MIHYHSKVSQRGRRACTHTQMATQPQHKTATTQTKHHANLTSGLRIAKRAQEKNILKQTEERKARQWKNEQVTGIFVPKLKHTLTDVVKRECHK